ncbi:MAG: hypothetical protein A3H27_05815 [Acidobacteria bacterium RIFCSPLOWO2_02_FULL_59_13]|nr:MAG: hypothetical protein A3H27_05815 [Acidobacteria bacterium RIFCSPLOWO2_02_FULL_59_13]
MAGIISPGPCRLAGAGNGAVLQGFSKPQEVWKMAHEAGGGASVSNPCARKNFYPAGHKIAPQSAEPPAGSI